MNLEDCALQRTVSIAPRLYNAGPDEAVVSSTVKDLVVGSGISFSDRGTRELRGVPGEWHLFAVDQVEAPPSSRRVPDSRERRLSFTNS